MVIFVLLPGFMTQTTPHHCVSADLPRVLHPAPMPGARRDDAMTVTITREGKPYFGTHRIDPAFLPAKIAERLQDRSVERKAYITADMRASWGAMKPVLDGVPSAGVLRVAFLAVERNPKTDRPLDFVSNPSPGS